MTLTKDDLQLNLAKWSNEQLQKALNRIEQESPEQLKKMTYQQFLQLCKVRVEIERRIDLFNET